MNKKIKIFISILGVLIVLILLDTLQARIFKTSPILSWKEELAGNDSWVDKGLLIDTYYCTKEKDIVTVSWHFKNSKFTCPIDDYWLLAEDISMSIKEGTLTRTGATVVITDLSGNENTYGEEYRIDRKVNDTWQEVSVIVDENYGFNEIGYLVGEDNTLEITHNWGWLYGELEEGVYRLVKKVNNTYISAEFKINDLEYTYEKATESNLELVKEVELTNYGNGEKDFTKYKAYIKDKKLYALNLNTNEEAIIFDKEDVKNISIRPICCVGNGNLLILTTKGNVYISEKDCNYSFGFDFSFKKLEAKDVVSFKLVPVNDYDYARNLYGINSLGEEILLQKIN